MKNYKKGFIVPLVWGIVLLLVLGLGTYIYINQRSVSPVVNQFENNLATSTNTAVQIINNNQVQQSSSIKTTDYTGFYVFAEFGVQDPSVIMVYSLDIYKENNSYVAYLNIDGYQTKTRIKAKILQKDSTMSVVFDSYLKDNIFTVYKKGDVLLTLISTNTDKMKINWNIMKPSFANTDINKSFFEKSKTTQQNIDDVQKNIIGKWSAGGVYSISFMSDGTYQEEGTDSKSLPSYGTWKALLNLRGEDAADMIQVSMPNGAYLKITPQSNLPMYYVVDIADGIKLKYTYLSGLAGAAILEFNRVK